MSPLSGGEKHHGGRNIMGSRCCLTSARQRGENHLAWPDGYTPVSHCAVVVETQFAVDRVPIGWFVCLWCFFLLAKLPSGQLILSLYCCLYLRFRTLHLQQDITVYQCQPFFPTLELHFFTRWEDHFASSVWKCKYFEIAAVDRYTPKWNCASFVKYQLIVSEKTVNAFLQPGKHMDEVTSK